MALSTHNDVQTLARELTGGVLKVFVGRESTVEPLILGLLSGLHVLLEDIPGVGKTTLALSLARCCGLDFGRIQFTPDLLPGDIIGMTVWNLELRDFQYKSGAIHHQFILGDEINRASERTQSAMLEAMAEARVSVDGVSYDLPSPFFVVATQNPSSFAGTFLLPESQTDRFGISFGLGYPDGSQEKEILFRFAERNPLEQLPAVCTPADITAARAIIASTHVSDAVAEYMVTLCASTRKDSRLRLGVSPRGARHLMTAAQGRAAMEGRDFVIPEDVREVAPKVLAHRLRLSGDAQNRGMDEQAVLSELIAATVVPAGGR